jgi:hypothetical protein
MSGCSVSFVNVYVSLFPKSPGRIESISIIVVVKQECGALIQACWLLCGLRLVPNESSADRKLSRNGVQGDESAANFNETTPPRTGLLDRNSFRVCRENVTRAEPVSRSANARIRPDKEA